MGSVKGFKNGIVPADYKKVYLDPVARKRYEEKVALCGLSPDIAEQDPYQLKCEEDCPLPPVTYGDIYNYLVHSVSFATGEQMRAYKQTEAYEFFFAGNIEIPLDTRKLPAVDKILIRAKVHRSQGDRKYPHHAWVLVFSTGAVEAAHCTCMAGLGETCSHAAAILYATDCIVRKQQENISSTSVSNWWLPPSARDVKIAEIRHLNLDSPNTRKRKFDGEPVRTQRSDKVYMGRVPKMTADESLATYRALAKIRPSACAVQSKIEFLDCSTPLDNLSKTVPSLIDMFDSTYVGLSLVDLRKKAVEQFENVSLSDVQIEKIFLDTKTQHTSPTWGKQRVGRATASRIGDIFKTIISDKPSLSHIKNICFQSPKSMANVPALKYGRENEQNALTEYSQQMSLVHANFSVFPSGMKIKSDAQYVSASPDGLVLCNCCGEGLVEVKCPYSIRDSESVDTLLGKKDSFLTLNPDGDISLKETHKYYYQIQCQLAVFTEAKYCDFVVWCSKDILVLRIYPNHIVQNELLEKARDYFFAILAPQMMANYFVKNDRKPLQEVDVNKIKTSLKC